jgi:hypothetical protein
LERLEVQTVVGGDNDLTVNHASFWQLGGGRRDQFGKVPRHRPLITATELDLFEVVICKPFWGVSDCYPR